MVWAVDCKSIDFYLCGFKSHLFYLMSQRINHLSFRVNHNLVWQQPNSYSYFSKSYRCNLVFSYMFKYYFKIYNIEIVNLFITFNKFYLHIIVLFYNIKQGLNYKKILLDFNIFNYKLPDEKDRRELFKLQKKRTKHIKNMYSVWSVIKTTEKYYGLFKNIFYATRARLRKWWWSYIRHFKKRSQTKNIIISNFMFIDYFSCNNSLVYYRLSYYSHKRYFFLYRCFYKHLYKKYLLFNKFNNNNDLNSIIFNFKYHINHIFYNLFFFYINLSRFKKFFLNFYRIFTYNKFIWYKRFYRFKYNKKKFFSFFKRKEFYSNYTNIKIRLRAAGGIQKLPFSYFNLQYLYLFYVKYKKYNLNKFIKKRIYLILKYLQDFNFNKKILYINLLYLKKIFKYVTNEMDKKVLLKLIGRYSEIRTQARKWVKKVIWTNYIRRTKIKIFHFNYNKYFSIKKKKSSTVLINNFFWFKIFKLNLKYTKFLNKIKIKYYNTKLYDYDYLLNYKLLLYNKSLYFKMFLRIFNLNNFIGLFKKSNILKLFSINITNKFFGWKKIKITNKFYPSFMINNYNLEISNFITMKLRKMRFKRWLAFKNHFINYDIYLSNFFKQPVKVKLINSLDVLSKFSQYERRLNIALILKKRRVSVPYFMKRFIKNFINILIICLKFRMSNLLATYVAKDFETTRKKKQWKYLNVIRRVLRTMRFKSIFFLGFHILITGKINRNRTRSCNLMVGLHKQYRLNSFDLKINFSFKKSFHLFGLYSVKVWFFY